NQRIGLSFLHRQAVVAKDVLPVWIVERYVTEFDQGRRAAALPVTARRHHLESAVNTVSARTDLSRGRSRVFRGYRDQVRLQRQQVRDAVPARDRYLEPGPQRGKLPQRVVKAAAVHEIGDQKARREMPGRDQVDPIHQYDQLSHARQEAVDRHKDIVGDPGSDRARIIARICLREPVPEIITAIECQYDLEIVQRFLDLRAQVARRLCRVRIPLLYPFRHGFVEDPHQRRRRQHGQSQPPVEIDKRDPRAGDDKDARYELHQRLAEELIDLVGVVVDPRNEVPGLVLREESHRQFLQLIEYRIAQGI